MSLWRYVDGYLAWAYSRGLAELSIKNQRSHLKRFVSFLEDGGVSELVGLTREEIERYMEQLSYEPTRRGSPMKLESRNVRLWSIKCFCRWLWTTDMLPLDPSESVGYARRGESLPKLVLSETAMNTLLAAPDPGRLLGYRDRVVLELLYSSGLRVNELHRLDVGDLDPGGGLAHVRYGKGGFERVVPVGRVACELVQSYLADIRPALLERRGDDSPEVALILSRYGRRLGTNGIGKLVARHAKAAGLEEHVTPHTFRHSCATHMLRGGANVRHLQEFLGHRKLTSTAIYTRVTVTELKEVHARFHPRGKADESALRPARKGKKQG